MKLSRYFEFLNENFELVLESDVIYSEKLKKVLKKMENPLAKKLLDIENKDYPVQNNYFDITDANDTISFIQDRRAKAILDDKKEEIVEFNGDGGWLTHNIKENGEIFSKLGYEPIGSSAYEPGNGEKGTVVSRTVSPTSGRTYVYVKFQGGQGVYNQNALSVADNRDEVWKKHRQSIRIGRGVRAIINSAKIESTDKEIEEFVNQYKATIDNINDVFFHFEVVTGNEIEHWYHHEQYEEGTNKGSLSNSCMADAGDGWFDIYTQNPEKVSLVIYKSPTNDKKIKGRALLWKLDSGKFFMDRIYTHNDSDINLFRDFCKKKGWYYKSYNGSSSTGDSIGPNGESERLELNVTLKPVNWDNYPYLDTIKYYTPKTGLLSNKKSNNCYTLEDTDGGRISCDDCGGSGRMECSNCSGDGSSDCYRCDGDGERECGECDGSGHQECSKCEGSGNIEVEEEGKKVEKSCPDCNGDGEIDCDNCDGDGEIECSSCDGNGREECDECDGNGEIDCPECS